MEWTFWRVELLEIMRLDIPMKQRTLGKEIVISGIGLHTKEITAIRLLPAKENTGIVFSSSRGIIGADHSSLGDSFSTTGLTSDGFQVEGVEHILSALYGMFITNVEIVMLNHEIPQGDGSSFVYVDAITSAGIVEQNASRLLFVVKKPVVIEEPERFISITPSDNFTIDYSMGFPYPEIVHGEIEFTLSACSYLSICGARTWAERSHINRLHAMGRGKALEGRCIIIEDGKIEEELRYEDETMRHKVLDCIGDLSLLYGMYILGRVRAHNAGHKLHHLLVKGLLDDSSYSSSRRVLRYS